jgi:hypothetical protein
MSKDSLVSCDRLFILWFVYRQIATDQGDEMANFIGLQRYAKGVGGAVDAARLESASQTEPILLSLHPPWSELEAPDTNTAGLTLGGGSSGMDRGSPRAGQKSETGTMSANALLGCLVGRGRSGTQSDGPATHERIHPP